MIKKINYINNSILNFETKLKKIFQKNAFYIFTIIIVILLLLIRYKLLSFGSADMINCLEKWYDELKLNGGLAGVKKSIGDYNAPYLTIIALLTYLPISARTGIKLISIIFDFILAISSVMLVNKALGEKSLLKSNKKQLLLLTFSIVMTIPSVLLNSAMWGQCDSIYSAFVLLAFYYLLDRKNITSFVFLGLAFAFKLQFIFVLPIYIILYFSKRSFSIFNVLIIPIVNLITCVPAIILGKPISDIINVYINQTKAYNTSLTWGFLNVYKIFPADPDIFKLPAICITFLVCCFALYYVLYKKIKFNYEKIYMLTLWFYLILTLLLPFMHERYLFTGEVLSIIYYICFRKNLYMVISININALFTYSNAMLTPVDINMSYLTIIYMVCIVYFTKDLLLTLNNKVEKIIYEIE